MRKKFELDLKNCLAALPFFCLAKEEYESRIADLKNYWTDCHADMRRQTVKETKNSFPQ